jgi:dolichol-phosphate mannosyltransferase
VLNRFPPNIVDHILLVIDNPTSRDHELIGNLPLFPLPVAAILHKNRRGIGYAIREGIRHALAARFDIIVVMAGNAKDDPKEIPQLLEPLLNDNCDYVQGSRFLSYGKDIRTPFLRRIFSRLYPFIWTWFTRNRLTDVTNGFRAYKTKLFHDPQINIWQTWLDGYCLEYYLHYKVLTLGYKIKEVPVSKIYSYRNRGGYSKIRPLHDWWQIVSPLIYLKLGARK